MIESELRTAVLKEMDEATFIRLGEFAYTGDYSDPLRPATFQHEPTETCLSRGDIRGPSGDYHPFISKRTKKGKKRAERLTTQVPNATKRDELWSQFNALHDCDTLPDYRPPRNNEEDDFAEMFLTHARLYAVADWAFIASLQELTLYKLHRTLLAFNLCGQRAGDVVSLIDYVYENTCSIKDMRGLVSLYAACRSEQLWESSDFQAICVKHGDFARDYIDVLHRRFE